jgi:hypothetical protein
MSRRTPGVLLAVILIFGLSLPDSFWEFNFVELLTIVMGALAILGAIGPRAWRRWRDNHTYDFSVLSEVEVGQRQKIPITVEVQRDVLLVSYMFRFSASKNPDDYAQVHDRILNWWTEEPSAIKDMLPRKVKRGHQLQLILNVDAKAVWKGYLHFEAADGTGGKRTRCKPFEVVSSEEA